MEELKNRLKEDQLAFIEQSKQTTTTHELAKMDWQKSLEKRQADVNKTKQALADTEGELKGLREKMSKVCIDRKTEAEQASQRAIEQSDEIKRLENEGEKMKEMLLATQKHLELQKEHELNGGLSLRARYPKAFTTAIVALVMVFIYFAPWIFFMFYFPYLHFRGITEVHIPIWWSHPFRCFGDYLADRLGEVAVQILHTISYAQ